MDGRTHHVRVAFFNGLEGIDELQLYQRHILLLGSDVGRGESLTCSEGHDTPQHNPDPFKKPYASLCTESSI